MKLTLLTIVVISSIFFSEKISKQPVDITYKYLSTKTPYNPPKRTTIITDKNSACTPIFINHLSRHGSRHLTKDKILLYMTKIFTQQQKNLTVLGKKSYVWLMNLSAIEQNNFGKITLLGQKEQENIASRMLDNFDILRDKNKQITVTSTYKNRAKQSAQFFLSTFFKEGIANSRVKISNNDEIDFKLRFFKQCPKYIKFKNSVQVKNKINQKIPQKLNDLSKKIAAKIFKVSNLKDPTKLSKYFYKLCQLEYNLGSNKNFCSLFSQEDLYLMGYIDDLETYYKKASSLDDNISIKMSFPLLLDFITSIDQEIKKNTLSASLRFAHAETIISFLGLTQIVYEPQKHFSDFNQGSRKWYAGKISPMSANIQWILYKCKNSTKKKDVYAIKTFINEVAIKWQNIKSCENKEFCPWHEVKQHYYKYLQNLDIDLTNDNQLARICEAS